MQGKVSIPGIIERNGIVQQLQLAGNFHLLVDNYALTVIITLLEAYLIVNGYRKINIPVCAPRTCNVKKDSSRLEQHTSH